MENEKNNLNTAVATQLRMELAKRKMTQKALAEKSGVPHRTIARYLSGERDMTLDTVDQIARALKLTLWELLDLAEKHRG